MFFAHRSSIVLFVAEQTQPIRGPIRDSLAEQSVDRRDSLYLADQSEDRRDSLADQLEDKRDSSRPIRGKCQ